MLAFFGTDPSGRMPHRTDGRRRWVRWWREDPGCAARTTSATNH